MSKPHPLVHRLAISCQVALNVSAQLVILFLLARGTDYFSHKHFCSKLNQKQECGCDI